MPSTYLLYRIVTDEEWKAIGKGRSYSGAAHDLRDGFIHLSAEHQIAETLAAHYAGRSGLCLLTIRADLLEGAPGKLVWEASRGGELFPHFYGSIPVDAVVSSKSLALDERGTHVLPELRTTSQ